MVGDLTIYNGSIFESQRTKEGVSMKGDIPVTISLRPDLRLRLKAEARKLRTSQGKLLERLLEKYFRSQKEGN